MRRRRDILTGAASLCAGASLNCPAPAIGQSGRQLTMVTDWPDGTPGLHTSAVRFARSVGAVTGNRIQINIFPAGTLVKPFETFDAVSAGVADIYHTDEAYFEKKSPAFHFFAAVPFGFTADELFAWIHNGGGQGGSADALSRKIFNSYEQFRASVMDWSDLAERAFLNSRRL
jgi:TRAP-type mannitol/chloroaromatic compound transport system substrate-binding protein